MPGAAQWRQIVDPPQDCWVCSQSTFVLVFWNRTIGLQEDYKIDALLQENLLRQIEGVKENKVDGGHFYYCQATNWDAKELLTV